MLRNDISLKPFNTFGIEVNANRFGTFSSIEELKSLLSQREANEPLLILGGGSNLLLTKPFEGLVLKNEIKGFKVISENQQEVVIESGAGEVWHQLVMNCIENGYAGLENLSLIPGSVGASPMQNIGAYGVEIKDNFEYLDAFEISTGELKRFKKEDCQFGYRESVFKNIYKDQFVICSVAFRLSKNPKINTSYGAIESELQKMGITSPTIRDVSNAVIAIRQSKLPDPDVLGNAGSFFKNPVIDESLVEKIKATYPDVPNYPAESGKRKLAAGWLIETSGWKGKVVQTCGVHKLQALVLVNYGGSTGKQVYDLSTAIIEDVNEKFGVRLEREVNIL
ncbi:MAG: UDP-N-acetylmuramate dehydrogenase [Crocinitomicaceae bacterium]|jgi:UDP-N-acetylmuramate dehydrogenase